MIQVETSFLILSQEGKKSLCSQGAGSHRYRETRVPTVPGAHNGYGLLTVLNSMKKVSL